MKKFLAVALMCVVCLVSETYAKGGGGFSSSSGSRSSFGSSSRSYSSSSNYSNSSSKSVQSAPSAPKLYSNSSGTRQTTNPPAPPKLGTPPSPPKYNNSAGAGANSSVKPSTSKSFFGSSINKKVSTEQSKAASAKYEQQKSQFKGQPTPIDKSKYQNSFINNKDIRYNPRNYTVRREQYYSSYSPPSYVYMSPPNTGMYDTMFLYMMLSNANNHNYSNMYYNHQNDPDMVEWRRNAEKQAETNAELKTQLAVMDEKVKQLKEKGVAVDPNYTPEGVDKDLIFSKDALDELKKDNIVPESEDEDENSWVLTLVAWISVIAILSTLGYLFYVRRKNKAAGTNSNYRL